MDDGIVSILHLPEDSLSLIFQYLDSNSDRNSFGLTCHTLLKIQNIGCRSFEFQSRISPHIDCYNLYRLLNRFQYLEQLALSGCTELPDSGLVHLQHYCTRLQNLALDCCFAITDNGLSVVVNSCPSLTIISLCRCNISDVGLEYLACLSLTHVNLSYCQLVTDKGLSFLSKKCQQLQAIKISNCMAVRGIGLTGCSSVLTYIDVESCTIETEGITGIVSGGGLGFLNISGMKSTLSRNCFSSIGSGLAVNLKILNMRMCTTIGDESIMTIAKGCPLLEEWNLASCYEVRLLGWETIGLHCNNLRKLHVNRCRNLCDSGILAIRNGCKQLSILYMNGKCRVSVTAIELFKLYRSNVQIKTEEIMIIGPDWTFKWDKENCE